MNTIKSLSLAALTGIAAVGTAQAADPAVKAISDKLTVKTIADQYMKTCPVSLYGAGFYYIPGTNTCMKIGGFVKGEVSVNSISSATPTWNGDAGQGNRFKNAFFSRGRIDINVDTRTETEWGPVRTWGEFYFNSTTFGGASYNPAGLATNLGNNLPLDSADGGTAYPLKMFVEFAGFTFGRSSSAYASPWEGYIANDANGLIGGDNTGFAGVNNVKYTAQLGKGVSTSFSLDDPSAQSRTNLYNLSIPLGALGTGSNAYAGIRMPDVSANVKVDQAWGLLELMGQIHQVDASYNVLAGSIPVGSTTPPPPLTPPNPVGATAFSSISGHPNSAYGYALSTSLKIANIPTGLGDDLKFQGTYAKGDTRAVIAPGSGATTSFAMFGNGLPGQLGSLGFGATTDGVYQPVGVLGSTDGSIHLTTAIGLVAAYEHNWNAEWNTSIYGSQSWVRYDATARAEYCAAYAITVANPGTYVCNPNYAISEIGSRTMWTPFPNLILSFEALWMHLGTGFSGFATLAAGAPFPTGVYQFKGQSTEVAMFKVLKRF